jgi:hypothetical protein
MLIFKGKAKNLNISKELEKNFGVYFHPTILQVDRKGEYFEE